MSFDSFIFFFKQKTAYEMRISDWSSDVCSSDLACLSHYAVQIKWRPTRNDGLPSIKDPHMNTFLSPLGRAGLSLIFIISGWGKIAGYAATQQYMEAMGVPGALLPAVIALELGGGLAILAGASTRWVAQIGRAPV